MRFDERADSYEAHAAPQKRFAEALAAFAPFRRGARVSELGAGTGFLTAALLAQGVNVDATDASPAMVELGRQGLPAGWEAYVGEQDTLLHPVGVAEAIVGCQTVEGLGHDLRDFLTP